MCLTANDFVEIQNFTMSVIHKTVEQRHEKKPVSSGVSDQAIHKPACAATEASSSLQISARESRDIILSKQRTTKTEADLRLCRR